MKSLEKISEEIASCKECQKDKNGMPVAGEGNPHAKILFMGEAPGLQEAKTGRPFIGRSGKLLTTLLESIGIGRQDVYITSPVKYFPGKRAPTDKEIKHGMTHTSEQIVSIRPKIIVMLGRVAHKALIGNTKLAQTHGRILKQNGIAYFSTFHPAAALRFVANKKLIEKDFKKLKKIIRKYEGNNG